MIRILFLSASDNVGGAAKATLKLFKSLLSYELTLQMFVKKKITAERSIQKVFSLLPITGHIKFDQLLLSVYKNASRSFWSLAILPNFFLLLKLRLTRYDIIQLNWINGGFVPIRLLRYLKRPVVWRLSDSWAFTGGCHIPFNCQRYQTGCGSCPQLGSHNPNDISFKTVLRKQRAWKDTDITIVAPSNWLADNARRSLLFRDRKIVHIPTGVDIEVFKPLDFAAVRDRLNFDMTEKLILFGAVDATTDPNKGFHLLISALNYLYEQYQEANKIHLVIFGNVDTLDPSIRIKFKTTVVGMINDGSTLNEYYNVADVYVLPSLLENSPNTVIESMSAGTPVVAFDAGGTTEIISHLADGYLATAYSTEDLARGIINIVSDGGKAQTMGKKAREKVMARYDIKKIAHKYYLLYKELQEERTSIPKT